MDRPPTINHRTQKWDHVVHLLVVILGNAKYYSGGNTSSEKFQTRIDSKGTIDEIANREAETGGNTLVLIEQQTLEPMCHTKVVAAAMGPALRANGWCLVCSSSSA